MKKFKKLLAFTLAETLIVMGIICVVAALTIPNLNQSTGEKEKVARVKKMYATLEDALGRVEAVYGPISEWKDSELKASTLENRMLDFMKTTKDCGYSITSDCFNTSVYALYGTTFNPGDAYASSLSDPTGLAAAFVNADGSSIAITSKDNTAFMFLVDVDGPKKGETKVGKDVFQFYLKNESNVVLTPAGRGGYTSNVTDCVTGDASNCTGWVVDHDNMDYLKCDTVKDNAPTCH